MPDNLSVLLAIECSLFFHSNIIRETNNHYVVEYKVRMPIGTQLARQLGRRRSRASRSALVLQSLSAVIHSVNHTLHLVPFNTNYNIRNPLSKRIFIRVYVVDVCP